MVGNEAVTAKLVAVLGEGLLVLVQTPVVVCFCNSLHGIQALSGVLDGLLRGHEVVDIVVGVEHDLAEEHVLQSRRGLLGVVLRVVAVHGLDEVGKGRVEVLVFGV